MFCGQYSVADMTCGWYGFRLWPI